MTSAAKNISFAGVNTLPQVSPSSARKSARTAPAATGSSAGPELPPDRRTGFTMCPNWIYDFLLVEESPSIVKVVLFFNRNTTGRVDSKGRRIEFKQATYRNIASRMKMSVRAVGEAVRTALSRGYLVQRRPEIITEEKSFDKSFETSGFEGGFYALNWDWPHNFGTPSTLNEPAPPAQNYPCPQNDGYVEADDVTVLAATPSPEPGLTPVNERSISPGLQTRHFHPARQKMPVDKRQNLPACINKEAKRNKKTKKFELSVMTTASESAGHQPAGQIQGRIEFSKEKVSPADAPGSSGPTPFQGSPRAEPRFPVLPSQALPLLQSTSPSGGLFKRRFNSNNPPPGKKRRGSSAVGLLIKDLTREFGDPPDLQLPNISRALNLWQTTTLSEKAFLDLIYQARQKARDCTAIRHRRNPVTASSLGGQANRMPYFFKILSELSALATQNEAGSAPLTKETATGISSRNKKEAAGQIPVEPVCREGEGLRAQTLLEPLTTSGPADSFSKAEPSPSLNNAREWNWDLPTVWNEVCDALRGRFGRGQLAQTAKQLNLSRGESGEQLVLSAPGLPWLTKTFTGPDIAIFRLALRQFTGSGFELILA